MASLHFSLGFPSWLLDNLRELGITAPLSIQSSVLAHLREPRDLILKAATGSGKTLAYLLPILLDSEHRVAQQATALIVVPTRDLARQVLSVLQKLTRQSPWTVALFSSSLGAAELPAANAPLVADILVSTPGKLLSHLKSRARRVHDARGEGAAAPLDWSCLRYLVLDEIDRTMQSDYGHDWLSLLMSHMDEDGRQRDGGVGHDELVGGFGLSWSANLKTLIRCRKILCSATVHLSHLYSLACLSLHDPIWLTGDATGSAQSPAVVHGLHEQMIVLSEAQQVHKPFYLMLLILGLKLDSALIFANSIVTARRLYRLLSKMSTFAMLAAKPGTVALLSSSEPEAARQSALAGYHEGRVRWIVATDGSTRGLDLKGLPAVIQYDAPRQPQTYLHRIGRTARAGAPGSAYTLLEASQVHHFKILLGELGKRQTVKKLRLDAFIESTEAAASLSELKSEYHGLVGLE